MSLMQPLSYGMSDENVWQVKTRLKALGLLKKATHNRFGSDTRRAVKAFQTANGLVADGVVGLLTWEALFGEGAPTAAAGEAGEKAKAMARLAQEYVGHCYVWGASGVADPTDAYIQGRNQTQKDALRSIAYRDRLKGYGVTHIVAFDCSGFVSFLLREVGAWSSRRDCDGLWSACDAIGRASLRPGDLLFRTAKGNDADETHVGVYTGGGWVVHAKGRDIGVVKEGINLNGSGYWQKFGRLRMLEENV